MAAWSTAALSCWGKTEPKTGRWLPLVIHLQDAAAMAGELWDHFLPSNVKKSICRALNCSDEGGRALACWLAGLHDLGKISPDFAQQAPPDMRGILDTMRDQGMDATSAPEKIGHATVGQVVLRDWLVATFGSTRAVANSFACVIGGHHGVNPDSVRLTAVDHRPHRVGKGTWLDVRLEVLVNITRETGADGYLTEWLTRPLALTSQILLTGIVIMADWMVSDEQNFPYLNPASTEQRLEDAARALGLPRPWRPVDDLPVDATEHLQERFRALAGVAARPLQHVIVQTCHSVAAPPLVIVEGPMGIGKTEAALLGAEILAQRFGQGGVFVGLPTMATSNPMFARVLDWLQQSLSAEDASVALSHGKAALNQDYEELRRKWDGHLYGDEDAQGRALVNAWLRGRKRAGLASFVVGTIDQSLFAGLKSKHLALRHLGLAGKVVIIDECHAADGYMRTYLRRVLTWMGAYGTPVILLSATLPPEQRDEFVRAYAAHSFDGDADHLTTDRDDYTPRLTVWDGKLASIRVPADGEPTTVTVKRLADDLPALVGVLADSLTAGGCAGVICNTVGRAQDAFRALAERFGDDVVLAHSRFIAPDRARREAELVRRLGPGGDRPNRLIVVGTQVLEQSLDIDFDLLVTDLAPMDLVLQRIGRLHRHAGRQRPAAVAAPVTWLRGVDDWTAEPPVGVRGSQSVYGRNRLLRTAAVLRNSDSITLPDDIPKLVRLAYDPALSAPGGWETVWEAAEGREFQQRSAALHKASTYLIGTPWDTDNLNGWIDIAAKDPDAAEAEGHSQVRDSDDALEVIALIRHPDGTLRLPTGVGRHGGAVIPEGVEWGFGSDLPCAKAMASCTIRLPLIMCLPGTIDRVIGVLERQVDASGWQSSPWLKGQLALAFDATGHATVDRFDLHYEPTTGLTVTAREESPR